MPPPVSSGLSSRSVVNKIIAAPTLNARCLFHIAPALRPHNIVAVAGMARQEDILFLHEAHITDRGVACEGAALSRGF